MNKILCALAALFFVAGCNSSQVSFSVDNPTDAVLKVRIDQQSYDIEARKSLDIDLKAGEHSMEGPVTGKVKFIVYAERKGGLINPTLSDYVIVSEAYVTGQEKLKNFRPAGGGPFELDGVAFHGPFQLQNGLFIEKNWRFGVAEPFPESVTGHDSGQGGNIFSKIFRASDFVSYFEKQSGQAGYFEKHRQHQAAPARSLPAPAALPEFADPQMQSATLKLRELYRRYQLAADPTEQKQIQADHFKLIMDLTKFAAPRLSAQPEAERIKYNEFVMMTGNAMGRSAQVLAP